jgi:phosphate transport system permease protein
LTFIAFLPPAPIGIDVAPFINPSTGCSSPFTVMPIQMFNWTSQAGSRLPRERSGGRVRAGS